MGDLVQITRYSKTDYYELIGELDRRKKETIFEPQLPLEPLTKFAADSVTAAGKGPVPNCSTCGVCCAFPLVVPVRLSDSGNLKEYWDITLDDSDNEIVIERVLPRDVGSGCCSHLEGELGKEVGCSIYPNRPSLCREFEAGSDRCHEYRRMYGLEPQLDPAEFAADSAKLCNGKRSVITYAAIVVDSVSRRVIYSSDDPERLESLKTTYLKIIALLEDDEDTEYEVHTFDASKETWFESDLIGMTLQEARQVVTSRD